MKSIIKKSGLLAAMLLTVLPSLAFEIDGLRFSITSMSDLEVEVVGADKKLEKVIVPQNVNYENRTFTVTSIGNKVFAFSNLAEITLPSTIRELKFRCFENCKFSNIILPNSLETIGYDAFSHCENLSSIVLPPNLKTIDTFAFIGCKNLQEVFFLSPTPPSIGAGAFRDANSSLEQYVPSVSKYGFGKEYLSFETNEYTYNRQTYTIQWKNNLKAYKCTVPESECITEINVGEYQTTLDATFSEGVDFTVQIPYS